MLQVQETSLDYLTNLIEEITKSHSFKKGQKAIMNPKLSQSEKIKFALDYYSVFKNISLIQVLSQYGPQNPELKKLIVGFMAKYNLLIPYPNTTSEYRKKYIRDYEHDSAIFKAKNPSIKKTIKEYNHNNWLEIFNEDSIFAETKIKHPSFYIHPDNNNGYVRFDKERATKVKLAILDQQITPARCIVEAGYPYEAKGKLNEYFEYLKTLRR